MKEKIMAKITIKQLPLEITPEIIEKAKSYIGNDEQLLQFLKEQKVSKINSVFTYAALTNMDVNEAKSIVHFSNVWKELKNHNNKKYKGIFAYFKNKFN